MVRSMRAGAVGIFFLWFAVVVGCGGLGEMGNRTKMKVKELGFSMSIPRGWKLDKHNPRLCYKGNATGIVLDEPLGEKSFSDYVDALCRDFNGEVVSKSSFRVGAYRAVRAVIRYPDKGSTALTVFIEKGGRLIQVSFVVPQADFQKYRASMEEALDSMKVD